MALLRFGANPRSSSTCSSYASTSLMTVSLNTLAHAAPRSIHRPIVERETPSVRVIDAFELPSMLSVSARSNTVGVDRRRWYGVHERRVNVRPQVLQRQRCFVPLLVGRNECRTNAGGVALAVEGQAGFGQRTRSGG